MFNQQGFRLGSLLVWLQLLALSLLSCSQADTRNLHLLDKPSVTTDSEHERLRKLQLVRVLTAPDYAETDPSVDELLNLIGADLSNEACEDCDAIELECDQDFCLGRSNLCQAKLLMAAALPQPAAVTIGNYVIPEQTSEVQAALAMAALKKAKQALSSAGLALDETLVPGADAECAKRAADPTYGVSYSAAISSVYADAFHTYEELTDIAVKATIAASDAQFASSNSLSQAVGRAVAGEALSRTAAAHLLTQGDPGLLGSTTQGFCTSSELTPEAAAAVSVFRDSALSPVDLLDDSLSIDVLLNGVGTAVSGGSVRQRIANLYQYDALLSGTPVEQYYGLSQTAFAAARSFLKGEIKAFSRSLTATLPAKSLPGGATPKFSRFSATAGPPVPLPAAYYGAIARFSAAGNAVPSNPPQASAALSLDQFVDAALSHAAQLLRVQANPRKEESDPSVPSDAVSPLALLVASQERTARFSFQRARAVATVTVDGFAATDGLRFLVGEDQLRCAVQGNIEGADCTDIGVAITTPNTPPFGFETSTTLTIDTSGFDTVRVYVAKPKLGVAASAPAPGQFEALAGTTVFTDGGANDVVPIVPSVEKRIAAILEPSKNWCAHSKETCAGTDFDERLPLENELSSDQDGVESSWKHYLQQAKDAAAQADALGADYVNAGLQLTQNQLDVETRREQQRERADDEIEKLQSICGTHVDPRKLFTMLTDGTLNSTLLNKTAGGACDPAATPSTCGPGYSCTATGIGAAPIGSITRGICIGRLGQLALTKAPLDPDLQRLADCVIDPELVKFVSLGSKPVCLWYDTANPNLICQDATGACPVALADPDKIKLIKSPQDRKSINPTISEATQACGSALGGLPAGKTPALSVNTNFFDINSAPPTSSVCALFRQARAHPSDFAYRQLFPGVPFQGIKLADTSSRISYEMRYGGFASIDVDGAPAYATGSATVGPNTAGWPCSDAARPADCKENTSGALDGNFMCRSFNCTDPAQRAKANYMMLRAVLVAKTMPDGYHIFRLGQALVSNARILNAGNLVRSSWGSISDDSPQDIVILGGGQSVTRRIGSSATLYAPADPGSSAGIGWYSESGGPIRSTVSQSVETQALIAVKNCPQHDNTCLYLGGFDRPSDSPTGDWQWVERRLRGTDISEVALPYQFGHSVSDDNWYDGNNFTDPNVAGELYLQSDKIVAHAEDVLNGYELLCEVGAQDLTSVSLASPPTVTSVADLTRVSKYIASLAQAIKDQAGTRLFANIPSSALSALQRAGSDGSYPQYSGELGDALSRLRGGLVRLQETIPQLSNEVAGFGYDLQTLHDSLAQFVIQDKIADLQMWSNISSQLASCASTVGVGSIFSGSTVATCANSVAQIAISTKINDLTKDNTELESKIATQNFGSKFSSHATNMQTLALHFAEASEDVDASLATIDGLRAQANVSIARALDLASFQAESAATVSTVVGNLYDGKQIRYRQALTNAKRMAFLAKRAIEQRIGVRLSDLKEALPLVDAPSKWEPTGCTMTGLNYSDPNLKGDPRLTSAGGAQTFANGFIGDYVTKLQNVVESYQLVNSFHEGTDTAVISLRDDLMNVRAMCPVASRNLLYHSSNLQQFGTPGWTQQNCTTEVVDGVEQAAPNCVSVDNAGAIPASVLPDAALANASAYTLKFGSGATATAQMTQVSSLNSGTYRFSWYTPDVAGAAAGFVNGTAVQPGVATGTPQVQNVWGRRFIVFTVVPSGGQTAYPVTVGFTRSPASTLSFKVAGPMLEKLPDAQQTYALSPFVGTAGTLTTTLPACEDTDGSVFRSKGWQVGCQQLCADGFASQCDSSSAKTYCYHQASFGFNQHDIQLGKVLNFSGFARGNFNYRIESVAVNFVGTGTQDCSTSASPSTCSGAGFIPYSLSHQGPFYVRNYQGQDFRAHLFDGNIEHARGLSSERYVTNPLSSSDQGLIEQYMRGEFQGRPLDGNFVLRVWDEQATNFDAIQDVQLVLKYRYWTRLN